MNAAPACRFCGEPLTLTLIDLGETPLANSYIPPERLNQPEPRYPLHVRVCHACRLAQVDAATAPENIFSDYAYFSSYSASWVDHARRFAALAVKRFGLTGNSMVVEVASNDGYLLQHFKNSGIPVLGVEPAANVAGAAVSKGVPTDISFFGLETARRLRREGKAADLLVGNNVYAHVPDINDFTAGLAHLLKPEGVISLEFPHLLQLMDNNQFDTIYHEHFSYLSLLAVERIFARNGLRVFDVEELSTHGGSLRVLGCLASSAEQEEGAGLIRVRAAEEKAALDTDGAYHGFEERVHAVRASLLSFLRRAKEEGKSVAAYGAAAKGNTLLNYCNIGPELVTYVVDRSPHKQGRFLPGSRLPVHAPEKLFETKPDYILILPWNLRDEICAEMAEVRQWGARFVVAIPYLRVLDEKERARAV